MGDLDVVFDVDPWFPNLYIKAYPECKIIWYSRNYEDWIISCRKYFGSQLTEEQKRGCYEFFGNYSFNHVKFTSAYFAHIQMMIHFNNTVPVLKIMPCDEDPETCKKNLSTFLNKSWPDSVPWPHENKS